MSANSNNQQINVFNKGMNTDTSDLYLPSELYRFAENLRFITNDGENSGELRLIEGYKEVYDAKGQVLGVCTARDWVFIVIHREMQSPVLILGRPTMTKYYCIYAVDPTYTEYLIFKDEQSFGDHLSMVTRWEDDNNVKLYIADGKHQLMSIKFDTTNPDEYSENPLGFTESYQTLQESFGGFEDITDNDIVQGNLKPAIVQYAYVLYNNNGGSSSLSPLSKPVKLYKRDNPDYGFAEDKSTGLGVNITIKESAGSTFDKIQVYRVLYYEVGQQPKIDLIAQRDLGEGWFKLYDVGDSTLSNVTFSEFISKERLPIVPNYIESKNDYLFAANNKVYSQDSIKETYELFRRGADATPEYKYVSFNEDYDWSIWGSGHSDYVDWQLISDSWNMNEGGRHDLSLRRDEIYRYGIVLYDKFGKRWPAVHILDLRTPPYVFDSEVLPPFHTKNVDGVNFIEATKLGVSFKIKGLDNDLFPKYEIVRCNRTDADRATISQGIVGYPLSPVDIHYGSYNNVDSVKKIYPSGFITLSDIFSSNYDKDGDGYHYNEIRPNHNFLLFASPELSYTSYLEQFKSSIESYHLQRVCNMIPSKEENAYAKPNLNGVPGDNIVYWTHVSHDTLGLPTLSLPEYVPLKRFGENGLWLDCSTPGALEFSSGNFEKSHPDRNWITQYSSGTIARDENYISDKKYGVKPIQNILRVDERDGGVVKINYNVNDSVLNLYKMRFVSPANSNDYIFSNSYNFLYSDNNVDVGIDGYVYVPWSIGLQDRFITGIYNSDARFGLERVKSIYENGALTLTDNNSTYSNEDWTLRYPIGKTGACIIFGLNGESEWRSTNVAEITIANLRKNLVVPYGGENEYDLHPYYSRGNYFNNDSNVHDVYDGDCYLLTFYYNALTTWQSDTYYYAPQMSTVYIIPIETDIDMESDFGDSYKRKQDRDILDCAVLDFKGYYNLSKDAYMYNTAYNADPTLGITVSISDDDWKHDQTDCRISVSMPKTNNEMIDSWTDFKSGNFIDVDTRYGQITNMRLFKNTLLFWQEKAAGVVSVNERTMLQDVNETNIILGNGDVLQRYDYITTEYGMKAHQMADTQSDSALYWWDAYKKEIVAYGGGQQVLPMKKTKLVSNIINSCEANTKPALAYDTKYNEVLANVINPKYLFRGVDRADDGPLVYSEIIQQFTSMYTAPLKYSVSLKDRLMIFDDRYMYEWNKLGVEMNPYLLYVVNTNSTYTKVYDNISFGLGEQFYDSVYCDDPSDRKRLTCLPVKFEFETPLNQQSELKKRIENVEYDFKLAIPRADNQAYGGRLRGKTMRCALSLDNNSYFPLFSLQYIITKFRISFN